MDGKFNEEVLEELENVREGYDHILHLNYQNLQHIPSVLLENERFQHLRRIYLKQNVLKNLPEDIGKLKSLVELYLHSNYLEELPEGLSELQNLESLDVSCNNLKSLPGFIGKLPKLEHLHAQQNKLESLPPEIGQLQNLQVLDVINNKLKHIPKEIAACSSLTRLLIDRNELSWIPKEIVEMGQLQEFSASGNRLLCLPMDMGEMRSLKSVYVDNNPYLHAVPVGLDNHEIGFSCSGTSNMIIPRQDFLRFVIRDSQNVEKVLYLPREIEVLGSSEFSNIPTLCEMALRATYKFFKQALCPDDLPREVLQLLRQPVSLCQVCRGPIFTMGYPVVFDGEIQLYSLYKMCLCCSPKCVKLASLIINLRLVYPKPKPSSLQPTVGLAELPE